MNTDTTKKLVARSKNIEAPALLERALPFLEQLLAAQGDNADRGLIRLQHEAVECLAANMPPLAIMHVEGVELQSWQVERLERLMKETFPDPR